MGFITAGLLTAGALATGGATTATGLASLALVTGGVGAGISAFTAIQQGQWEKDLADKNADIAEENARIEAASEQRDVLKAMGASEAAIGASGVSFLGTPLDILAEQAAIGKERVLLVKRGGQIQSRDYGIRGLAAKRKGELDALGTATGYASTLGSTELAALGGAFGEKGQSILSG